MLRLLLLGLASQALAYAGIGAGAAVARRAAPQMAAVAVADFQGASAGEEQVNLKVAKAGGYVVHRKVVAEQANMRLGTAVAKTRAEVRGGGRKPYQQKGTGRARRGSSRSPLLVGGGKSFGPRVKSYKIKMNKKEKQLAISTGALERPAAQHKRSYVYCPFFSYFFPCGSLADACSLPGSPLSQR